MTGPAKKGKNFETMRYKIKINKIIFNLFWTCLDLDKNLFRRMIGVEIRAKIVKRDSPVSPI
tara:strand:+ start:4186 stop:4371 length:186 start_codon:yes stop_codon:yes gene_type:complete